MVGGDHRHGCVDGFIVERHGFSRRVDGWGQVSGALGAHRHGGLYREHITVFGFIGAGAGADIKYGAGRAEGEVNDRGDPRVSPAVMAITDVVAVVVKNKWSFVGHGTHRSELAVINLVWVIYFPKITGSKP